MVAQLNYPEVFRAGCLLRMIFSGLSSSRNQLRRITYRFAVVSGSLNAEDLTDHCDLLKELASAQECFVGARSDNDGQRDLIRDDGNFIEEGRNHPASFLPNFDSHDRDLKWACDYQDGKEFFTGSGNEYARRKMVSCDCSDEQVYLRFGTSLTK